MAYQVNLTKSYDGKKNILHNLQIDFNEYGSYGIIGRSGVGKSTLFNILSGLDTPTSGGITYNNKLLSSEELREKVAVVYQDFQLLKDFTVADNIGLAMALSNANKKDEDILLIVKNLGIYKLMERKVDSLSGGEKQRVAIARAYLSNKSVIVADEPTGNLDKRNAKIVFQMLKEIAKEKLVIIVSHDKELVKEFIDNIFLLDNGEVTLEKNIPSNNEMLKPHKITRFDDEEKLVKKLNKKSFSIISQILVARKFLMNSKVILVCMLVLSVLSLSIVIGSFSTIFFNPIERYRFNSPSYVTANCSKADYNDLNKLVDEGRVNIGVFDTVFKFKSFHDSEKYQDEKNQYFHMSKITELISNKSIKLIYGHLPNKQGEFIIDTMTYDHIIKSGTLVVDALEASLGNNHYKNLKEDYCFEDLTNEVFYSFGQECKIVGVSDNYDSLGFYKGFFDFLIEEDPNAYYANVLRGDYSVNINENTINYKLIGDYSSSLTLTLVEGNYPIHSNEILLNTRKNNTGDYFKPIEIGESVTIKLGFQPNSYKVVGYAKDLDFSGGYFNIQNAYLSRQGLQELINKQKYNNIIFHNKESITVYNDILGTGAKISVLDFENRALIPAIIIAIISSIIFAVFTVISFLIILKNNKQNLGILYGIGAKAKDIAMVQIVMSVILLTVIIILSAMLSVLICGLFSAIIANISEFFLVLISPWAILIALGGTVAIYLAILLVNMIVMKKYNIVGIMRGE